MRYELDNEGYVLNVYFGCYGENCVEYEGNIPNGYTSLVEWSEKANINAYYIKDGNLTYNAERDKEICKRQELEVEEYAYATKGYVNSKLNVSSTIYDDNMTKTTNDLVIKDAGEYEIPEIVIEGAGDLKTATNKIEDARAGKSQGIKIKGKSIQDGEPSSTNKVEIQNVEGVTNLFDGETTTELVSDSGTISKNNYWNLSEYILVEPNEVYTFSRQLGTQQSFIIAEYDENKTFIKRNVQGSSTTIYPYTITTSETTKYVRLNYNNTFGNDLFTFIKGKNTDYVPYGRWLEVKTNTRNMYDATINETGNDLVYSANNEKIYLNGVGNSNKIDFKPQIFEKGTYTLCCEMISGELVNSLLIYMYVKGSWTRPSMNELIITSTKKQAYTTFTLEEDTELDLGVFTMTSNTYTNLEVKYQVVKGSDPNYDFGIAKENTALIDMNKENLFDDGLVAGSYNNTTGIFTEGSSSVLASNINDIKQGEKYYFKGISGSVRLFFWNDDEFVQTYIIDAPTIFTANGDKFAFQFSNTLSYDGIKIYEGIETDDYYRLASIGDTKDTFKDGVLTQRIGKVVLDGSESWNRDGLQSGCSMYSFYTNDIKNLVASSTECICDYLKYTTNNYSADNIGITINWAGALRIKVGSEITTIDELKIWLSENQVEVYYTLATPIEHTLNYEVLELHEGYNNITTNDELDPDVDVTYISQKTTLEDGLVLQVSNDNQLVNEVLNHSINGLKVEVNEDKSITINGTATADTEIVLNGSNENVEPIFMLNDKNTFTLSGLTDDITLNLYNYDGTDKTLLFSGTSGEVNIEGTQYVTYSTLSIVSGTKVNATITPMITASDTEYKEAKLNDILDIDINELQQYEKIKIDRNYVSLVNDVTKVESVLDVIDGLNTFTPTLIQTNHDRLELTTKYFPNDYLNERFAEVKVEQDNIRSEVSATYITKVDSANNISTAKGEAIDSANSSTDEKLKSYSTTKEVNASLELKINKDDLVSEINAKANVITLTSDNFKLDANGKITATSGKIGGWEIGENYLYSDYSDGTYDYRAYLQPILSQSGAETWVYSIQKKKTSDTEYVGVYYVMADGTIYTDGTIHAEGCIETPSYILANDNIQSNTGFFTGNSYLAPNGAYVEKQLVVDGNVVTSYLATAKKDALNICGYAGNANGGEKGLWLSTANNITLNPLEGSAYVRIGEGSSYKISTAGGNLSSLNLKENLKEFKEEDYNDAIDLLREIELYNFDYKYDINNYENNYGFIIDYIKEKDKTNKFFNFNQYKAVVNENKTLDEAKAQEEPDNENIIEYERYSEESLVKYLLTVCKAQQKQIDELKESIKALN